MLGSQTINVCTLSNLSLNNVYITLLGLYVYIALKRKTQFTSMQCSFQFTPELLFSVIFRFGVGDCRRTNLNESPMSHFSVNCSHSLDHYPVLGPIFSFLVESIRFAVRLQWGPQQHHISTFSICALTDLHKSRLHLYNCGQTHN